MVWDNGYYDAAHVWHNYTPEERAARLQAKYEAAGKTPGVKAPGVNSPSSSTKSPTSALEAWAMKEMISDITKEPVKEAVTAQTAPSVMGNFGSLGFGPQAGVIAGTTMTLKGLNDLRQGRESDLPTRAVTAMSTFGGSELARALGFGKPGRDYADEQRDRIGKLKKAGVEMHSDFSDYGDSSKWKGGEKLPDVNSLQARNIWGLPAMYEKYGNDWLQKFDEKKREDIAQAVIDSQAVRNKDYQTDVDWENKKLKEALGKLGV